MQAVQPVAEPENKIKEQPQTTHVIIALDASGSMQYIKKEAIELFNNQVTTIQENMPGKTTVSFGTFGMKSQPKIHYICEPAEMLEKLDAKTYNPDGMTPLNDCLGKICETVEQKIDRDEDYAVLVILISDGMENYSGVWQKDCDLPLCDWRFYTSEYIREMIQRLEATGRWTFTHLGANQTRENSVAEYGLNPQNVFVFEASAKGVLHSSSVAAEGVTRFMQSRRGGATQSTNFYKTDD